MSVYDLYNRMDKHTARYVKKSMFDVRLVIYNTRTVIKNIRMAQFENIVDILIIAALNW